MATGGGPRRANGRPVRRNGPGHPWRYWAASAAGHTNCGAAIALPSVKALEKPSPETRGTLAGKLWLCRISTPRNPPLKQGGATGSALPLAWTCRVLKRSARGGWERSSSGLLPVAQSHWFQHQPSNLEVWNIRQPATLDQGKALNASPPSGRNSAFPCSVDSKDYETGPVYDTRGYRDKVCSVIIRCRCATAVSVRRQFKLIIQWLPPSSGWAEIAGSPAHAVNAYASKRSIGMKRPQPFSQLMRSSRA